MTTVLTILTVWFLASIVIGLVAGRFIAAGQSGDLSRYLANPKDDDQ
jgi:hypothetical protein